MFNLNATLGLGEISADTNDIPDGKYEGKVLRSQYVLTKTGKVSHAITYQVTSGTHNGAQRPRFQDLGKDPVDANGNPATKIEDVANFTPTMSDEQKKWYKKMWVDHGIPEDQVVNATPADLEGRLVNFGVKTKDGFKNVNFVEVRTPVTVHDMSLTATPVALGQPNQPLTPQTQAPLTQAQPLTPAQPVNPQPVANDPFAPVQPATNEQPVQTNPQGLPTGF